MSERDWTPDRIGGVLFRMCCAQRDRWPRLHAWLEAAYESARLAEQFHGEEMRAAYGEAG